jgi:hypothetical protein
MGSIRSGQGKYIYKREKSGRIRIPLHFFFLPTFNTKIPKGGKREKEIGMLRQITLLKD